MTFSLIDIPSLCANLVHICKYLYNISKNDKKTKKQWMDGWPIL